MKFMIALLMAVLPALSVAQSQPEAGQSLPSGAIPKTTAVLVIQTSKQGVTVQQVMAMIPDEIQATVKLYLDGKIREFAEFMISPFSPGFNFDRYDGELRRPFPFEPQSAPESKVWRREHGITDPAKLAASLHNKAASATSRPKWLESH
jgi:hypothetical protein